MYYIPVVFYIVLLYLIYGYPLFSFDSFFYLEKSITNEYTNFGSILYPLILRSYSLWLVVLFQLAAGVYIVIEFLRNYCTKVNPLLTTITFTILYNTTFFLYSTSILTDVFLGIGILSNVLILSNLKSKIVKFIIFTILGISSIAHNGYIYVFLGLNASMIFYTFWNKNLFKNSILVIFFLLGMKLLASTILKQLYIDNEPNKSVNVECRVISVMHRSGTFLNLILQHNCPLEESNFLCENRKIIKPTKNKRRAFEKIGLNEIFKKESLKDCRSILIASFKTRETRFMLLKMLRKNIEVMFKKSFYNNSLIIRKKNSELFLKAYQHDFSIQNSMYLFKKDNLKSIWNKRTNTNKSILTLSIVFILLLLILDYGKINYFPIIFISMAIFYSIGFYGLFSAPDNIRYVSRLTWIIPLICIVLMNNFVHSQLSNIIDKDERSIAEHNIP